MKSSPFNIYIVWMGFLAIGGVYMVLHLLHIIPADGHSICFFKNVTGHACPGCGTTRAILVLLNGQVIQSVLINPMGLFSIFIIAAGSALFVFDFLKKENSLERVWLKFNASISRPMPLIILLGFIAANWVWNISKGL